MAGAECLASKGVWGVRRASNHVFLTPPGPTPIGDTGIGLPDGLDIRTTASLGWHLVRLLTEQLRGTLHLERHAGTTVTITFPL